MSKIYAFFTVMILLAVGSCDIINPTEPVPTYIHLDSFTFSGSAVFGSSSHDIKVAYVYLNSQTIGAFDLPATVPIILDKPGTILVTPGIYTNGLSGYPSPYPFYRSDTFTLTPNPGKTFTPNLKTNYFAFTNVLPRIEFEPSSPFKLLNGDVELLPTTLPGEVFEGVGSGVIRFSGSADSSESISTLDWKIPTNTDVFLELDYKCTVPFTIGMYTDQQGTARYAYLVGFYPTTTWKKAYISLRSFVNTYQSTASIYNMLIKSTKVGSADGIVLLDNIKVVTF